MAFWKLFQNPGRASSPASDTSNSTSRESKLIPYGIMMKDTATAAEMESLIAEIEGRINGDRVFDTSPIQATGKGELSFGIKVPAGHKDFVEDLRDRHPQVLLVSDESVPTFSYCKMGQRAQASRSS